ncbi:MAG: hypothetical protein DRO40_10350 [Thermoprotei archaeon]|nr:MAG: hypothetical protein DRO40_10350 [Thermoprotei archaeon]
MNVGNEVQPLCVFNAAIKEQEIVSSLTTFSQLVGKTNIIFEVYRKRSKCFIRTYDYENFILCPGAPRLCASSRIYFMNILLSYKLLPNETKVYGVVVLTGLVKGNSVCIVRVEVFLMPKYIFSIYLANLGVLAFLSAVLYSRSYINKWRGRNKVANESSLAYIIN